MNIIESREKIRVLQKMLAELKRDMIKMYVEDMKAATTNEARDYAKEQLKLWNSKKH